MSSIAEKRFASFAEFYPFYLGEHSNRICRDLHFIGSTAALLCIAALFLSGNPWWLLGALASGYAFAWVGHFMFEKTARPPSSTRFIPSWATG